MSESESPGYERRDLNTRVITWFFAGLTLTLILIFVGIHFFLLALGGKAASSLPQAGRQLPPLPRLQTEPVAALATFRAAQEAELHRYRWVDRQAGVIEIPIERAMDLTIERGLPSRPPSKERGSP